MQRENSHYVFHAVRHFLHKRHMNNLARYRELRGLSQEDLAEVLGVSQPTIHRAETESASAKLSTYKRCADVLGVSVADIFSERTSFEDAVLTALQSIAPSREDEVLAVLRLATGQPHEAPE